MVANRHMWLFKFKLVKIKLKNLVFQSYATHD